MKRLRNIFRELRKMYMYMLMLYFITLHVVWVHYVQMSLPLSQACAESCSLWPCLSLCRSFQPEEIEDYLQLITIFHSFPSPFNLLLLSSLFPLPHTHTPSLLSALNSLSLQPSSPSPPPPPPSPPHWSSAALEEVHMWLS